MNTWIFQGNPDEYDIDAYLASRPAEVVWLVTRYTDEIAHGDRVYLWRNQGQHKSVAGIIAEAVVTAPSALRDEDADGVRFWRTQGPRAIAPQMRAGMRLLKVATAREVIRRDWCKDDPILRHLANIRMQAGTNYPVTPEQARRLSALWSRTGRDWNRSESIAGLWTYAQTFAQPISQIPGSPVANTALLIGRAVSGLYAKVMNFRSIDPRVPDEGMSGAGDTDRRVWSEFYDSVAGTLRVEELSKEFARLWLESAAVNEEGAEASAATAMLADEAGKLEKQSLEELIAKYRAQARQRSKRPRRRTLAVYDYDRDPLVIAIAQKRAGHRCEIDACAHPTFGTEEGLPYTEVHHIMPLSEGGPDTIENVACLCPAHHREVHFGARASALSEQLKTIRTAECETPARGMG
jgi:5-methylcytosine-specific restriction endonuclease McrA